MPGRPASPAGRLHHAVYTWNEDEDPYALLAALLKETGIATGSIGIEERVSVRLRRSHRPGLSSPAPPSPPSPSPPAAARIKSPAELALMQLANDITLSVYKAV